MRSSFLAWFQGMARVYQINGPALEVRQRGDIVCDAVNMGQCWVSALMDPGAFFSPQPMWTRTLPSGFFGKGGSTSRLLANENCSFNFFRNSLSLVRIRISLRVATALLRPARLPLIASQPAPRRVLAQDDPSGRVDFLLGPALAVRSLSAHPGQSLLRRVQTCLWSVPDLDPRCTISPPGYVTL